MDILDLYHSEEGWYHFYFQGTLREENDAIEEIARRIATDEWDHDESRDRDWGVKISTFNSDVLMDIFDNGKYAISALNHDEFLDEGEDRWQRLFNLASAVEI